MRAAVVGLLLVTVALLETTLFPYLSLAGFRPDLLLLVVIAFALRDGASVGLRVGFAAGLLVDAMVSSTAFGLHALLFTSIGYAVGVAKPYLAPESVSAPLVVAFTSGFLGTFGVAILMAFLGQGNLHGALVVQASLIVAIYNSLLAPIVFAAVTPLVRRFPVERAVRW